MEVVVYLEDLGRHANATAGARHAVPRAVPACCSPGPPASLCERQDRPGHPCTLGPVSSVLAVDSPASGRAGLWIVPGCGPGQAAARTAACCRAAMALSRLWLTAHRCSSRSTLVPR